jgi:hypothetical protein
LYSQRVELREHGVDTLPEDVKALRRLGRNSDAETVSCVHHVANGLRAEVQHRDHVFPAASEQGDRQARLFNAVRHVGEAIGCLQQ